MTDWLQRCVLSDHETLEIRFGEGGWRLAYLRGGEPALVFEAKGREAQRVRAGRRGAYALRSVEQLRYDFEREMAEMRRERRAAASATP